MGIEPSNLKYEQKWHFLERIVTLVENNYNLCELGLRGTISKVNDLANTLQVCFDSGAKKYYYQ